MIEELTAQQEIMMEEIEKESVKRALGGDTSYNTENIEKWINFIYRISEMGNPEIIICASPSQMFEIAISEYGYKNKENDLIDWNGIGYDSGWTSFYIFMEKIGVDFSDIPEFEEWKILFETGIWGTLLFEKQAFVCLRPSKVKVNANDDLHCIDGKAIEWIDGSGFYYLNSIRVPEWLVMTDSGQIDPKKALTEKNVDIQREIIRKIGAERMLKACNAKTLDTFTDHHINGGNEYKLMEMKVGQIDRKYLYFEHASLPGVWYAQPVPPTTKKAIHGRAWILGIGELNELEKMNDSEIKKFLPAVVS